MIIERKHYLERLISRIDNQMIEVVTGVRRSGKSFLLFNLFYHYLIENGVPEDHIITLSLDDIDYLTELKINMGGGCPKQKNLYCRADKL